MLPRVLQPLLLCLCILPCPTLLRHSPLVQACLFRRRRHRVPAAHFARRLAAPAAAHREPRPPWALISCFGHRTGCLQPKVACLDEVDAVHRVARGEQDLAAGKCDPAEVALQGRGQRRQVGRLGVQLQADMQAGQERWRVRLAHAAGKGARQAILILT